jgi:hypothetical protein
MEKLSLNGNAPAGVYEIDANGILIFSSVRNADSIINHAYNGDGVDFFQEVTKFRNTSDLQRRFELFKEANVPTESFDFTCSFETEKLTIRVLLARLVEGPSSCSFLVYIRDIR